jgi:hypothetical protein
MYGFRYLPDYGKILRRYMLKSIYALKYSDLENDLK